MTRGGGSRRDGLVHRPSLIVANQGPLVEVDIHRAPTTRVTSVGSVPIFSGDRGATGAVRGDNRLIDHASSVPVHHHDRPGRRSASGDIERSRSGVKTEFSSHVGPGRSLVKSTDVRGAL